MREHRGFLLFCLLFGFGLCAATYQEQADGSTISDFIGALLLGLAGLVLFVVALVRALKRTDLSWRQRLIPLTGWVSPLLISYMLSYYLTRLDRAPNWLVISNRESVGYASFDFKGDGRYKYTTGSPLGSFYGYGRYIRRDSLLHLLPEPGHEIPPDTLLVIRPYSAAAVPLFGSLTHVLSAQRSQSYPSVYYVLEYQKSAD